MMLRQSTISRGLGDKPFQVADADVVSNGDSGVTVHERPAHEFEWREGAVAHAGMGVEVMDHDQVNRE